MINAIKRYWMLVHIELQYRKVFGSVSDETLLNLVDMRVRNKFGITQEQLNNII